MSSHRRLLPALVASMIVAGAIAGFIASRSIDRDPSNAELQAAASSLSDAVSARLESDAQLLATAAGAIDGDPSTDAPQLQAGLRSVGATDRVLGVARGSTDTTVPVVAVVGGSGGNSIAGLALGARPEWRLALELSRDEANANAILVDGADGDPAVLEVFPLYGTSDAPADIASRRAGLKGFVVVEDRASEVVGLDSDGTSDVTLRVTAGPTVLGATGRGSRDAVPSEAVTIPVTTAGVAWTVQAWGTPSSSPVPWYLLAGGCVLAVAIGALVARRERAMHKAVAEAEARNQELALVARAGPVLQQSLALGDLLPVFVVEVGDELHLDGIAISLCDESGDLVRVFSLGSGPATPLARVDAIGVAPESVEPGEGVAIPLQRAGRVVGVFEARAVAGLNAHQMNTLTAACALLASAVGNVRLYEDEQDLVGRLRDVDRMKTSFIGSVSHELRTSVTAIQGFADLLETGGPKLDSARRADYVERISRNARSLNVLVEDLLDFARFERSGLAAALRPIDVSDLVPKVVDQMSSVLDGRELTVDVAPSVVAMADSLAIERILVNLLSNAAKYTPAGTQVHVRVEQHDDLADISVSDHGPGIPVDERERIFDLFYRSDQSARVTRGVGIGLALARQLTTHLNGTIAVDDAPGGGACFRLTIPLADRSIPLDPSPIDAPTRRAGG